MIRDLLKGSIGPKDNDSRFLLDVHRRDLPGEDTMRRYDDADEVDICIVGAGAGGSVLAQRLARAGWRVVIIEAGPFWHPDEDWVSDEAGSHELYWNQKRIIGGADPIEMGKNNSGRGVGGSMVHYAGYTPRFHPSDFRTHSLDGVGADWPIGYEQTSARTTRRSSASCRSPARTGRGGTRTQYPFSPHPVSEAAAVIWRGAIAQGIEMRVGPVGIVNGTFGNRPHCIYRGYCLQGCKVNAKASPYVTHLPDALAHRVEIRADCMAARIEIDSDRPGHRRHLRPRGRARRTPAAGPARRRGRLLHRDAPAPAQLHLSPLPERPRQQRGPGRPVRDGPGRHPERRAVPDRAAHVQGPAPGGVLRAVLRDRHRPAVSPEGSPSRPCRPSRSGGPSTSSPTATGAGPCASTCATTTTGPPSASSTNSSPTPTTASPWPTRPTPTGCRSPGSTTPSATTTRPTWPTPAKVIKDILHAAGAQDVLTIQRYAHLVGGARMGTSPADSVVDANQRTWGVPNLFISDGSVCPTQGSANPALTIMALASRLAERMISGAATSPANK